MKGKSIMMCAVVSIYIGAFTFSFASEISWVEIEKMSITELIELLNDPDWRVRALVIDYGLRKFREKNDKGFSGAFKEFEGKEQLILALINLLEKENAIGEKWWEEYEKAKAKGRKVKFLNEIYGEGYGEYCIELIDTIIYLKDKRAIPALVGAVEYGAPAVAIIELGELAIKPLLERLHKTKNPGARSSIIKVLAEIAKKSKSTPQPAKGTLTKKAPFKAPTVSQIGLMKEAFIKNLNDPDAFTRMEAIRALGILGDTSVIPLLQQIAKNDPCAWGTVYKDPAKVVYPVRKEARRVLKLLEEKKNHQEVSK